MLNIAKRNLLIFFRDRSAVFFSFLSSIIVIALYAFFLGDSLVGNSDDPNMRFLMDSWLVAGLVAISSFSGPLGAYTIMVEDKNNNAFKNFIAAPIKRHTLTGGYILSSLFIGVIISLITLIIGQVYIVINGGSFLPFLSILKVLVLVIFSTLVNSALLLFITSFIKTLTALNAFTSIAGTLIGFIMGIYVPLGVLPSYIVTFIKLYPGSYAVSLLRMVFMEKPLGLVFEGAPQSEIDNLLYFLGTRYEFGGNQVSILVTFVILISAIILFYGLSILVFSTKRK